MLAGLCSSGSGFVILEMKQAPYEMNRRKPNECLEAERVMVNEVVLATLSFMWARLQ